MTTYRVETMHQNRLPMFVTRALAVLLVSLLVGADEPAKVPPGGALDHDPEAERRSFKLLPGFEVNLFAAEPMLVNPIHMTWDARGRLWVCTSTAYPQLKPGQEPDDQIVVLEDTDGDGKADRSTVFADGLHVPTGLELGDGGVYVANAPDLLFLEDTDGDGKADRRRVVLTGFGTEDNHHCISAWRWGPGGWLYFQEGTFLHSQVETPRGPVRLENGGVFQFRPRGLDLRVFADYRASNPWGHMFDRWGQSVLIDNPRLYFLAPMTANSRAKLPYEASGSGTKQCGGEFASGTHLPEEFRGQIWTNQYKTNTVARYAVADDGAGFSIKGLEPLIVSSGPGFRPVDLKIGPDGAAYVLDWYNPLIGHMQHSFRDPRRDNAHGRVWRVTSKGRPLVKKPDLVDRPLPELLDHLKAPEDWTRHQVKRLLYDQDPRVVAPALARWVAGLDPEGPGYEHHRLEALWAYQTIDVVNEKLLRGVLRSKDGRARAAALRVLRYWHPQVKGPLALLEEAIADPHPRVRLEAVLTLGYIPRPESVAVALRALDGPTDRFLDHALKLTVDGLQGYWLPAHRAGRLKFASAEHRSYALANVISDESVQVLEDLLNSGSLQAGRLEGPLEVVAERATGPQLEPLVLALVEHLREYRTRGRETKDHEALAAILTALDRAARQRKAVPGGGRQMVARAFDVPDAEVQTAAARLVGAWALKPEGRRLQRLINSEERPGLRRAAAESLGELGDPTGLAFLRRLTRGGEGPDRRYLGVLGLASHDLAAAAPLAAQALSADPEGADPVPVVAKFVRRKGGAALLAAALEKAPPHADVSLRVMQHLNEVGEQHPHLIHLLGGGVLPGSLEAKLLKEDVDKLAEEVRRHGDPARGERIFRREKLACMSCHGIGNAGPEIGPDLAAVGSGAPPDYVVDALLRPSKVIKEFYEGVVVVTRDDRVLQGILRLKDSDKVVLRDPAQGGKEVTIPAARIAEVRDGPSLMPTGLVNHLKDRQEFLDLARFLTDLGRPGPYAASVAQVVRYWQVAGVDAVKPGELAGQVSGGLAKYSLVSGLLPAEDLFGDSPVALAAARVDATHGGEVRLKVNATRGLRLFVGGTEVPPDKGVVELQRGRNLLVFVAEREARGGEGLRVELVDAPGSGAAYQVAGRP